MFVILILIRSGQLSNHFLAAILKAVPFYGWPTDVILKLLNNIPIVEYESKEDQSVENDSAMVLAENYHSESKHERNEVRMGESSKKN